MKLPGVQYGPVRSLGREDTGGPLAVAGAEYQTVQAWARTLDTAAGVANAAYKANAAAEFDSAMASVKRREAEVRALLTAGPTIDAEQTPIPEWVQVARTEQRLDPEGNQVTVPRRFYNTHEVAMQVYDGMAERSQQIALEQVKNPLARARLEQKLPTLSQFDTGRRQVQAQAIKYFRDQNLALVDVAIEEQVQALDEAGARATLTRAFATGLIDPKEYPARMKAIQERIDGARYADMILNAREEGELEQVESYVTNGVIPDIDPNTGRLVFRQSRLDADKQMALARNLEAQRDRMDERRTERHEANMVQASARFITGQLRTQDVLELLEADDIDHKQALSMANAIRTRARETPTHLKSNPVALDYFRRRIRSLRHLGPGERVEARRREIESDLQAAQSGLYVNGDPYGGIRVNGTDYGTLSGELGNEMQRGAARQDYKQALGLIRSHTQYSDMMAGLEGSQPRVRAYGDFVRGLDDYMDRTGVEARPIEWVERNKGGYDIEEYAGTNRANFLKAYPQYQRFAEDIDYSKDPEAARQFDVKVRTAILDEYYNNRIDEETARIRHQQLGTMLPDPYYDAVLREDVQ